MGFREQFLNQSRSLLEVVVHTVTTPIRNYRAEGLIHQQADALLGRKDLTYKNFPELAELAKATTSTSLTFELCRKMLWVGFAEERRARQRQFQLPAAD